MEIDGWQVKLNKDGGLLREVRGNPNLYMITILKEYAIDIELVKVVVDGFPKEKKQDMLIQIIKESIAKSKLPWEQKTHESN